MEQPRNHTAQASRFLPLIFTLFIASGCAALVYEIVWFQMLQLIIGSSGVSLGVLLGTFMGGMCLGSFWLPRDPPSATPASRLRRARARNRNPGHPGSVRDAVHRPPVHAAGRTRALGNSPSGAILRDLSSASDDLDGGYAAGHRSLGGNHSARRLAAGLALWRQHRRGRARMPWRRILSPARLRHAGGDIRRRGSERCCSVSRLRTGPHHAAPAGRRLGSSGVAPSRQVPGPSMSRSRFRA